MARPLRISSAVQAGGGKMSYVKTILQPGEVVLGETKLHWFIYLRAIFFLLLALVALIFSNTVDPNITLYIEILAAVLAVIGLWFLLLAWLKRTSTELAVTDRRVIHKTGLISRRSIEINREKVESVDVYQSLLGRVFNYGTILVRGVGNSWEPYQHIAHPLEFRSAITAGAPHEPGWNGQTV
jgi:uncharacterized membrane protein YdbT with pleckstrin-like domain